MRILNSHTVAAALTVILSTLACVTTVSLTASEAEAQDIAVNGAVNIHVRAIHASSDGETVSPELAPIQGKLNKAFGQYSSFKELSSKKVNLRPKASFEFHLPDNNTFELMYDGPDKGLAGLNIGIGKKFNTKVRASRGSTFFQAGLPYKDGILVIAISVE